MYIPEEKISEILTASDIVDIISENVILKKSGRNFFGLCPFHSEKTPSFSVNSAKQIFHCFGCSAGGNVISFIMKYHGITFPEAVKMLGRKYQIEIDTGKIDPAQQRALHLKEGLFRLNKTIMEYYSNILGSKKAAQIARDYLNQRKISDDSIEQFKLGFSPDSWDSVVNLIKGNKTPRQIAVQSGLVLERKTKTGYYDRFRNRIMFPIFDVNMQVAGFGGRVMDDGMPKYMNSPETPVYSKSRILYGLHASKQFCRQEETVFIVEGYFDFLSLFQHGIKNAVATLGTALTSDHVRILKGYAKQMILVFDSDAAGINAAKRSIALFLKEGVDTRILVLPQGNDPDSFVMDHGKDKFLEQAGQAKTIMQFLLDVSIESHGLSVEGRVNVLNDMKPYLAVIEDSALRSLYVKQLSEKLGIDERAVLEKVREHFVGQRDRDGSLNLHRETKITKESDPREKQLISMMLNCPQIIPDVIKSRVIDSFYSRTLRRLAGIIINTTFKEDQFMTRVMAGVEDEEDRKLLATLGIKDFDIKEDVRSFAKAMISRIIRVRKKQDNEINNKILSAKKGCDADMIALLKLKQAEIRQLHNQ